MDTAKHRMKMSLAFSTDGGISGDGIDDIAPFTIRGAFDTAANSASWTKKYVGMWAVEYRGLYDLRSICGDWMVAGANGGFWIWPEGLSEGEHTEVERELPVEQFHPVRVD
jgi:hypothetical protein